MDAETLAGIFGGLGVLTLIVVIVLGVLVLLVLPIFAIIDAATKEDEDWRVIWIVLLIATWGIGSIIYALFAARSRALRRFAVLILILLFLGLLLSLASCGSGLFYAYKADDARRQAERLRQQEMLHALERAARDAPDFAPPAYGVIPAGGFRDSSIAPWEGKGPNLAEARPVDERLNYAAQDDVSKVIYGLGDHELGSIDGQGRFLPIKPPPEIRSVSWGSGLAYDRANKRLVIASRAGSVTRLFTYDPEDGRWGTLPVSRGLAPLAIACDDAGRIYVLQEEMTSDSLSPITILNSAGATIGQFRTAVALPYPRASLARPQMMMAGKLLLIVPPPQKDSLPAGFKMYFAVPGTGEVFVPKRQAEPEAVSSTPR